MTNIKFSIKYFPSNIIRFSILVCAIWVSNEIVAWIISEDFGFFTAHIRRIADAIIFSIPILVISSLWFIIPYTTIVCIYFLSNVWFYRNFGTFIPLSQLFDFSDLKGLGSNILDSISVKDLGIIIPYILFGIFCLFANIRKNKSTTRTTIIVILCSLSLSSIAISQSYWGRKKWDDGHPYNDYYFSFKGGYLRHGIVNYWIIQNALSQDTYSEQELQMVEQTLEDLSVHQRPINISHSGEKRNLIVVLVESLSSWVIENTYNDKQITPRINELLKDSNSFVFKKCLTQTKGARSSDGNLLIETGLFPLSIGATSLNCFSNQYYSIAKAMKEQGYKSQAFLCDDMNGCWLQGANYRSYGYDTIYDNLNIFWDATDSALFTNALPLIKKIEQPFYAKLVTIGMHNSTPLITYQAPFHNDVFEDEDLKWYLCRTHSTDYEIGRMIDSLKTYNLFEKSIIVIIGDHCRLPVFNIAKDGDNPLENYYIPFIVINSPLPIPDCNKVIGQIDIYPSLLDIMGVSNYPWRGFGTSVFDNNHPGFAVHHSGEIAGDNSNVNEIEKRKQFWVISDIILRSDYFKQHKIKKQ